MGGLEAQLLEIERNTLEGIRNCTDARGLEDVRVRVLGKKGELTGLLRGFAELPASERPACTGSPS